MAIDARRVGWEVRVYAGVDPVTGKPIGSAGRCRAAVGGLSQPCARTEASASRGALSPSRPRDVHAVISGALALAPWYGWIPKTRHPWSSRRRRRGPRGPMPTKAQARQALEAALGEGP